MQISMLKTHHFKMFSQIKSRVFKNKAVAATKADWKMLLEISRKRLTFPSNKTKSKGFMKGWENQREGSRRVQ